MAVYDMVVPKDNMVHQINELVDFSFVLEELKQKYCLDTGRNGVPTISFRVFLWNHLSNKRKLDRSTSKGMSIYIFEEVVLWRLKPPDACPTTRYNQPNTTRYKAHCFSLQLRQIAQLFNFERMISWYSIIGIQLMRKGCNNLNK
jgi:hypothetical protein